MPHLLLVDLTIIAVTPLDQLLPCMKINATIRSHGDSFLVLKLTASLINPRQGSHLLHYIIFKISPLFLLYAVLRNTTNRSRLSRVDWEKVKKLALLCTIGAFFVGIAGVLVALVWFGYTVFFQPTI